MSPKHAFGPPARHRRFRSGPSRLDIQFRRTLIRRDLNGKPARFGLVALRVLRSNKCSFP